MSDLKGVVRRVLPLRTSTYLHHQNEEMQQEAAFRDEALAQIAALRKQVDALTKSQKALRKQVDRNQALLRDLMRKEDEYLDPALYAPALRQWFSRVTGRVLDLDNPRTFDEKMQWAKLYDRDPRRAQLADKVAVRDYVTERVGEHYLVPMLGTWRYAKEIDFDALPNAFVLKANHGCGYNAIVRDKSKENLAALRRKAEGWLREDYAFRCGFEMHYQQIERRLLAEEYLENLDGDMPDYKFWCFDGKVHFIEYLSNRSKDLTVTFFDPEWNVAPFTNDHPRHEVLPARPDQLDEMIHVSEALAEGLPYVRVDLYLLDSGEVKFSELTFTSASGISRWDPPEADLMLGELYHLPTGE